MSVRLRLSYSYKCICIAKPTNVAVYSAIAKKGIGVTTFDETYSIDVIKYPIPHLYGGFFPPSLFLSLLI